MNKLIISQTFKNKKHKNLIRFEVKKNLLLKNLKFKFEIKSK
jgi:hypothetical protein